MWKQGLESWGLYSFPGRDVGRHCSFLLVYSFQLFFFQLQSVCVCVCVLSRFSHIRLFATLWTVACQAPWDSQTRILDWVPMPSSRGSSLAQRPTGISCVSCIAGRFFKAEPLGSSQLQRLPCKKWRNWGKDSEGLFESLGLWSHSFLWFLWNQKSDLSGRGEFSF